MLEIGGGAISPAEGVAPIPFEGGKAYLTYDRASQLVRFTHLAFDSRAVRLRASGQALMRDMTGGVPGTILGQIAVNDLQLDPEGLFVTPARFSQGRADVRLRLDPFRAELGQVQLTEGDTLLGAKGAIAAGEGGWRVRLDTTINSIDQPGLIALWPPAVVPKTRDWVAQNVTTGELRNVHAALRMTPGAEPRLALGYEFRGAEVRVVRSLPPVQEGRGFSTILDSRHALMVEEGHVIPPSGGQVEVAGTTMVVPDVRIKPAPAVVDLLTRSPIPAALSLLDQKPFEFMKKAGRPTDLATGWAEAHTRLQLPLRNRLGPGEVIFDVSAKLSDLRSDQVVPGRVLEADTLRLRADNAGLELRGKGRLSGVEFDAAWRQDFGPGAKGRSRVEGYVEVSPQGLSALGIALPKGMVGGAGWGHIALDLVAGQPPRFDFVTDLKGISLAIPEVGWRLAGAAKGRLAVSGRLGAPPAIERLELKAPGLEARGTLSLRAQGGLERARFDSLRIGAWFEGAADLVGRRAAAPDVVVRSGRFDLRRAEFARAGAGSGAGGTRISATLDRVQITDTIALTGFRGDIATRGGVSGQFTARLNGAAPIAGTLAPAPGGRVAARITAADGGAAIAASGIFSKARGGALELNLTPAGKASYDGQLRITDLRVRDAPALASMLSAASGVGLLEQLGGEGIPFAEVTSRFRLTPQGVSVTSGEAIGASMGVTMAGNYYPDSGRLDMRGVISPFYIVNGIGQVVSRRGEGLFGLNYTLTGAADAPRITVNPLSILTPGLFRDIFRRDPPQLQVQ